MNKSIIKSDSISQLRLNMRMSKPTHPLITVIDTSKQAYGEAAIGRKFSNELYCIAMKNERCGIEYGRNNYDFEEGVLMFFAPNQVITLTKAQELGEVEGWMVFFHPDLIRDTALGAKIANYSFFSYEVFEALHLSEQEKQTLNHCKDLIEKEIQERIDHHSQSVLVSYLELLLNYSLRFYERQFNTRTEKNTDVITKVEVLLKNYFQSDELVKSGQPTIQYLATECHLSQGYLSDLLAKETGRSAKEHINDFLINKAKNLLLNSTESMSGIAYSLGFSYPHYFSRLFKKKTGMTPRQYRQQ